MVTRKTSQEFASTLPRQCAWNDHGHHCENTGILSDNIHGMGPWYCRDHYANLKCWPRWKIPNPNAPISDVDKSVHQIVARLPSESERDWSMRCHDHVLAFVRQSRAKKPGKEWAHKILLRAERSETLPVVSLQIATAALAPPVQPAAPPMREPGEDG